MQMKKNEAIKDNQHRKAIKQNKNLNKKKIKLINKKKIIKKYGSYIIYYS